MIFSETARLRLGSVKTSQRIRPIFHADLGAFFLSLRTEKGWKQRTAADIALRRNIKPLTRQVLLRLERGQTQNPKPEVLRALATLYERPYAEIVTRFAWARYRVSLTESRIAPPSNGVLSSSVHAARGTRTSDVSPSEPETEARGYVGSGSGASTDPNYQGRASAVARSSDDIKLVATLIDIAGAIVEHASAIKHTAASIADRLRATSGGQAPVGSRHDADPADDHRRRRG